MKQKLWYCTKAGLCWTWSKAKRGRQIKDPNFNKCGYAHGVIKSHCAMAGGGVYDGCIMVYNEDEVSKGRCQYNTIVTLEQRP